MESTNNFVLYSTSLRTYHPLWEEILELSFAAIAEDALRDRREQSSEPIENVRCAGDWLADDELDEWLTQGKFGKCRDHQLIKTILSLHFQMIQALYLQTNDHGYCEK
jgi:hypothetical protein